MNERELREWLDTCPSNAWTIIKEVSNEDNIVVQFEIVRPDERQLELPFDN